MSLSLSLGGVALGENLGARIRLGTQWTNDHHHVAAINHRSRLNRAKLRDVFGETLQETHTLFGAGLLTTAEENHRLHLVALAQKADGVATLGVVVVLVNLEAESNLFEDGVRLVTASFFQLLRGFILELAVIHDLCHRWRRVRSDLNEVEVCFGGKAQGNVDRHDSELLAGGADETNFRDAYAVVGAWIADGVLLLTKSVGASGRERRGRTW